MAGIEQPGTLKRRHLGIAGALTLLLQYQIGVRNEDTTRQLLEAMTKNEVAKVQLEQEENFVRKNDFKEAIAPLDAKLSKLDSRVESVHTQVSKIEGYLRRGRGNNFGHAHRHSEELTQR